MQIVFFILITNFAKNKSFQTLIIFMKAKLEIFQFSLIFYLFFEYFFKNYNALKTVINFYYPPHFSNETKKDFYLIEEIVLLLRLTVMFVFVARVAAEGTSFSLRRRNRGGE